jgi:predicted porin
MNKKLVAVAVAGVLGAPLAAHAQTANVTLYGRLNIDYELITGKQADGSNPNVSRVSGNSSRFGVRGTESLGGGLNAIFQLESGVNNDTGGVTGSNGTGTFGSRETFVGLQGSWGKFTMGKFLTPMDDMHPIFGNVPTYTTSILSTTDLWAQGTQSKDTGSFDARLGNSLRYDSPSWNGLTFAGQVSLRDSSGFAGGGVLGGGNNGDHTQELRHAYVWSTNVVYNNGPVQIGGAYEQNIKVRGPDLNDYDFTLTGAYNFGIIRPALVYERIRYETPTGDLKRDLYGVSLTAPLGPGVVYAFWGKANDGKGSAAPGTRVGGLAIGDDTGSQQWEISYTYPLSKRTQVYTGYVKLQNEANASYTFDINSYTIGVGGKPGGFVLGMIHFF